MCLQQSRGVARAEIRIDDAISGARGSMAATGWNVFDPHLCVLDAADIIEQQHACSDPGSCNAPKSAMGRLRRCFPLGGRHHAPQRRPSAPRMNGIGESFPPDQGTLPRHPKSGVPNLAIAGAPEISAPQSALRKQLEKKKAKRENVRSPNFQLPESPNEQLQVKLTEDTDTFSNIVRGLLQDVFVRRACRRAP